MYAVGKIPGGFIKREGRPSERATLTARLIDRPIRPMFSEGFRNEVQITNIVMSVEQRLYTRNGCNVWVFLSVSNFRYSV